MKISKTFIISIVMIVIFSFQVRGQTKYEINLKVKNITETKCFLSYYCGNKQNYIDTAIIGSNGIFLFQKSKPLPGGIYKIQFPNNNFFEFISDGNLEIYNINTSAPDLQANLEVSKSMENSLFIGYLKTTSKYKKKYVDDFENNILEYANEVISKNSNSFFAQYLKVLFNTKDKSSYFDNFNFAEFRLIRTKIFFEKINYYLDNLVEQTSEDLTRETTLIIEKSKADNNVNKSVILLMLEKYRDSENINDKQVYINIAKKYVLLKQAYWISDKDLGFIDGLVDIKQFEVAKNKNEISGYFNYLRDYPNGKYIVEAKETLEILKFTEAKNTNAVISFQQYLMEYPNGKFISDAIDTIEKLKFDAVKKECSIEAFEKYLTDYPNGKYIVEAKVNIERLKFETAQRINTLVSYNNYLASYPNGTYEMDAISGIETIKNKAKEDEVKLIAEKKQKEWEEKMQFEQQQRLQELEKAANQGVDALIKFADKWPNSDESQQAIRILSKYGAENNVLEKKVYVEDSFFWVADGDRGWLNDLYESNRNWMKGGNYYNIFVFGKLHNKSKETLKIQVLVNLNLIRTTNLSILSSSGENILTSDYLMELKPDETKGFVVLFKNVSEGSSYGSGWFNTGASQSINITQPYSINYKYYQGAFPQNALKQQQDMISTIIKNESNIKITRSGKDVFSESIDKWIGINSDNFAELYVYFQKMNGTEETLTISDAEGNVVKEDKYNSTGQKNESYRLTTNHNYMVYVPGYGEYNVFVKKRLTHLIIDGSGIKTVTYDN